MKSGLLHQRGLVKENVHTAEEDMLRQIDSDGIETVRFLFADCHGTLRGKALVAHAVSSALANGVAVPSSVMLKDTSSRTVFPVWEKDAGLGPGVMTGAGDMLLVPDASTFRRLPWSQHSAWVLCDTVQPDGTAITFAPRTVLNHALKRLHNHGMDLVIGLELEFHIYNQIGNLFSHDGLGMPGVPLETAPLNQGYQLLSDTEYARVEPILDELRRMAVALDIPVRSTEVEFGPSQFEFTFDPAPARVQADRMVLFRTMVKQICMNGGLHATFMCKPKFDQAAASGWHLHQSLIDLKSEENLFRSHDDALTPQANHWIAGLLEHAQESTLLTTPTLNGYSRYQSGQLAPDRIVWARDNKGAMLRVLMGKDDPASRVENRTPEPAANPYYAIAAQIYSGLSGLERELVPPEPVERPYDGNAKLLATTFGEAIEAFEKSNLYEVETPLLKSIFTHIKRAELERYNSAPEDWEHKEYFQLF